MTCCHKCSLRQFFSGNFFKFNGIFFFRELPEMSDWLVPGENMCPIMPRDAIKYTITSLVHVLLANALVF